MAFQVVSGYDMGLGLWVYYDGLGWAGLGCFWVLDTFLLPLYTSSDARIWILIPRFSSIITLILLCCWSDWMML